MLLENNTLDLPTGNYITSLKHSGMVEHFLTVLAAPGESPAEMFERLDAFLAVLDSPSILRMDIHGRVNTHGTEGLQQRYCYNCDECRLNHTRPDSMGECPVAGVYVHAVTGGSVKPVWLGGQLVGNELKDPHVRYVLLDNLHPEAQLDRGAQTHQLFERMEDALRGANMTFDDVARTWLYLDDILDWYDDFNQARTDFFKPRDVFKKRVPASTGVGGANSTGSALQASVLAAEALSDDATIQAVPSPLQCPALDYDSSFSRAVEIATPEIQRLYISGTASIDPDGFTLHVDDVEAQIAYTMEVIQAILSSRNMGWEDVVRGVAYVKHKKDFDRFTEYCQAHQLPDMPIGLVQNDVCRDDLLFELEVDAIKKN